MVIELILWALLAAGAAAVVVVAIVTFAYICDWFTENESVKSADKDVIAFTLDAAIRDNDYAMISGVFKEASAAPSKYVQGFYNQRTKKVEKYRPVAGQQADKDIKDVHRNKAIAIYN